MDNAIENPGNFSREQIINILKNARERTSIRNPDDLDVNDSAQQLHSQWCAQENPYLTTFPQKAAAYKWDLDRTMAYFDAGFDDPDYLQELAYDQLDQDLENAERDKNEEGMESVIDSIKEAVNRVVEKIQAGK
jgi:hypothetical protein